MDCLLQGATIIDPASPFHRKQVSVLIRDGIISDIGDISASGDVEIVNLQGKYISPGWMDMLAGFGDPGHEYRETISSGCAALTAGGFTAVGLLPNTEPALHSKAEIEYIRNTARREAVHLFPYGAVTLQRAGRELTEMYDMYAAGAAAFTDADQPIRDAGILLRSLQYVKPFNGIIINIPNDFSIVGNATINEGAMSVELGMYGIPDVLEELMVMRDIKLAAYTGSRIHLGIISSERSLQHIRKAKSEGIHVTAGVAAYQLYFDEAELHDYNAHFKVNPPLRTAKDKSALREAVLDGTIDVLCSYHLPYELDSKDVEFEYAAFGMATVEAVFGAARFALPEADPELLVALLSINPRKILNIPQPAVKKDMPAEITMFDMDSEWIFDKQNIRSLSVNNGFINRSLKGMPIGIYNKGQLKLNEYGNRT